MIYERALLELCLGEQLEVDSHLFCWYHAWLRPVGEVRRLHEALVEVDLDERCTPCVDEFLAGARALD